MPSRATQPDLPFWLRPQTVALVMLLLAVVRLVVSARVGLIRDEGYYTFWSLHPALGYLDHPPMVAWWIAAGRTVLGESELAVRLLPVLAIVVTSAAMYRIGVLLLDRRTAGLAVVWYNLTAACGLLFIAAPDAPSVTFWVLAVWAVAEFAARRNANWWLLAGLFAGLGLLSKYTGAFLGAGLLLYLVTSRERLGWLKLWQVWAGGAIALLVFAPNLIWNAQHGWETFLFQGKRLTGYGISFGSMLDNLADLLAGQLLASGVFLFVFVVIAAIWFALRRQAAGREGLALVFWTCLPLIAYFIAYTARLRVEANWPTPLWPALALAGAWAAVHIRPAHPVVAWPLAVARWAQAPLTAVLIGLIYLQAAWQPFELPQHIDRTRDMRGWAAMQHEVAALAEANGAQWIATGAGDYGLTGELASYGRFAGTALPVRQLDEPERWRFLPPLDAALLEQKAVFVGDAASVFFAEAELIGEARRMQGEEELERFAVYLVSGRR